MKTIKGKKKLPEYRAWTGMIQRCENPKNDAFKSYGGRGIKVCKRWRLSFESFLEDAGYRPSDKHTIERIDVNKGYSKSNVCWATRLEQQRNRRNSLYVDYKGERVLLKKLSEKLGIKYDTLRGRMRWGMKKPLDKPADYARHYYTFQGKTLSNVQWAKKIGIDPETLRDRLKAGWSLKLALTTKKQKGKFR